MALQKPTAFLIFIGLALVAILLPLSFHSVEHDEVAVAYYTPAKSLQSEVLTTGTRFHILGTEIFTFKRTVLTIDLSGENILTCLSMDGIEVGMDLTIQYVLKTEELVDILYEWGNQETLEQYVFTLARDALRNACSQFPISGFYFNRASVQSAMIRMLRKQTEYSNAHVDVQLVQLINIALPPSINAAIQEVQLALQDIDKAKQERPQIVIEAETDLRSEKKSAEILIIQAEAEAQGVLARARQEAEAVLKLWQERSLAYAAIMSSLEMNATAFVDTYLRAQVMQSQDNTVVGI